jgi:hypothetical protein
MNPAIRRGTEVSALLLIVVSFAASQQVIDNSNPLLLTSGNPSLNQSYTHTILIRYSETAADRARAMFILLAATMTNNYIANATIMPAKDTSLANGTSLPGGTQLTSPRQSQRLYECSIVFHVWISF